jgi:hypothetical protein
MDCAQTSEKSRDRMEKRTAYVTTDIGWMNEKSKWKNLACIGAIKTESERKGEKTEEWHYYISSRPLTAPELLHHARMEWAVETMHWLLDVHFEELDSEKFSHTISNKKCKKTLDKEAKMCGRIGSI